VAIGRDLLDLPFAEVVRNLAIAIAEGQTALDRNSLDTLRELVDTEIDVMTEIVETISPDERTVTIDGTSVTVTGARIEASGLPPLRMNMFQAGLSPTFYQFTEAVIEVKLSITMREERSGTASGRAHEGGVTRFGLLDLGFTRAYASTVDYRNSNAYDYSAQGASVLRTTMKPVPPPSRLAPAITTVNTFVSPPSVTRAPQ
jgi:hypothetical protein